MIISKTPLRISFFGGGSDYPTWYLKQKGEVISSTINKYIYIDFKKIQNLLGFNYRLVYSKVENVKHINQIQHDVIREALKYYKLNDCYEMHYNGDLPSKTGLGSSSSFIVGMINIILSLKNKNVSKNKLAKESINFERNILKETVGSQDQVAAAYGGFNSISFYPNEKFVVNKSIISNSNINKLNKNLVLIYTGKQRLASNIAKSFTNKLNSTKKEALVEILQCVDECKKILKSNSISDFGKLLNEAWIIKKKLSSKISSTEIDDIYDNAIKNGATGGKILGAGGGGFFIFYVNSDKQKFFLKKMKEFSSVEFKFVNNGSEIIKIG